METIQCTNPECCRDNAYFTIMDENGANYECPDCGHEWCDPSIKIDDTENED